MMLVVVSNPTAVANEAQIINRLFDEGLAHFHLRKPEWTEQEIASLIKQINPEYYSKIAMHQHHHLGNTFGIKRLHYTEHIRIATDVEVFNEQIKNGFILSTSIHTISTYYDLPEQFKYTFLGPVFGSISKLNYKAIDENKRIMEQAKTSTKLIALGGITEVNGHLPFEWGFDGIAVLGSIWEEENKEIISFNKIKAVCQTIAQ